MRKLYESKEIKPHGNKHCNPLGLMMLGLMTRVSLRHTGRPLVVPGAMLAAYVLMFVAAVLRMAATVHGLGSVR